MNWIRRRLGLASARALDGGLSLVEVIVAMMIFAMISVGVVYTMLSVLTISRDTRSRQVAANLAAQEIDVSRDVADLFALLDRDRVVVLNGDTFRVKRTTQWVSSPDLDFNCGVGGGALRYKRVNVEVRWDGMRSTTEPVRSDTVIDPKNRINDPALGTILVSVRDQDGEGVAGIDIGASPASPSNGAVALTTSPNDTDAQGCSYILKVTPGNYKVTASKSGYVDTEQRDTATLDIGVAASNSGSVGLQYDLAARYDLTYLANYTAGTRYLPTNLETTFLSPPFSYTGTATNGSLTKSWPLHPFSSGYGMMAGKYVAANENSPGCLSVDPAAWPDVTQGPTTLVGTRAAAAASRGASVSAGISMGAVSVQGNSSARYLVARSAASSYSGDPGCAVPMEYRFAQIFDGSGSAAKTIGLPFGSWTLYYANSSYGSLTQVTSGRMSALTLGAVAPNNIVTLDPRAVAP